MTESTAIAQVSSTVDAVLSCLPNNLNQRLAEAAVPADIHYFDQTENVPTTQIIIKMSERANRLMAPQCGLAPGFGGIVGVSLVEQLDE